MVKNTFQFSQKNFLFLLMYALPSAVLVTLATKPLTFIQFFMGAAKEFNLSGEIQYSFSEVFSHFSIIKGNVVLSLLFLTAALLLLALPFSFIERKIRHNTNTIAGFRSLCLDGILIMIPVGALIVGVVTIFGLISSGFVTLLGLFMNGWVWWGISLFFTMAIYLFLLRLFSFILCWIPCMIQDGYQIFMATSLSARLCALADVKIFLTVFGTLAISTGLVFWVGLNGIVSATAVSFFVNIVLTIIAPVYIYKSYFKLNEMTQKGR